MNTQQSDVLTIESPANQPNIDIKNDAKNIILKSSGAKKVLVYNCPNLQTLDLSQSPNINNLSINDCPNLRLIFQFTPELKFLQLAEIAVDKLPTIPRSVTHLALSNMLNLQELPPLHDGIKKLLITNCAITTLPLLHNNLLELNIKDCSIVDLPDNFVQSDSQLQIADFALMKSLAPTPRNIEILEQIEKICDNNQGRCNWPSYLNHYTKSGKIKENISAAYKAYYADNPEFCHRQPQANNDYPFFLLIHRFLNETPQDRGGKLAIYSQVIKVTDKIRHNPQIFEIIDEVASIYLDACINQPVAGFSEIATLVEIDNCQTIKDKLNKSKILITLEKIKQFAKSFKIPEVEAELANALLIEVSKKLLNDNLITEPFLGAPIDIAFRETIQNHINQKNIAKITQIVIKDAINLPLNAVADFMNDHHYQKFWTTQTLSKQDRDQIMQPYNQLKSRFADGEISSENLQAEEIACLIKLQNKSKEKTYAALQIEQSPSTSPSTLSRPQPQENFFLKEILGIFSSYCRNH